MGTERIVENIREVYRNIAIHEVYFALKKLRVHYLHDETVDLVRWCVAIQLVGFRVTVSLISYLNKKSPSTNRVALHTLGDRGVLISLKKGKGEGPIEWMLSTRLLENLPDYNKRGIV